MASLSFATAILGGCAANVDADGTAGATGFDKAPRPAETTTQELGRLQHVVPDVFEWGQGQGPTQMRSWSTHICVMTGASGSFRGGGESVRLFKDPNGFWQLSGASQQHDVRIKANCFPLPVFWGPIPPEGQGIPERWISDEFALPAQAVTECGLWPFCTTKAGSGLTQLWKEDAASFLTGISGVFDGEGEGIWVSQGSYKPSTLNVTTMAGFIEGRAHSFFVGNPSSGQKAQFWGPPDDGPGPEGTTQDYGTGKWGPGSSQIFMAPTDLTMCYAVGLSGGLNGNGESFDISPGWDGVQERWVLRVNNSASSSAFSVSARCYLFNQGG